MLEAVALLIVGLVLLVWSADKLVFGSAALARNVGISPLVIGMTILAMGSSAPEMMVSATAAWDGKTDTDIAAARREDCRIDANHFALGIEQRTAGIAWIDRRVDLQKIVIRARANATPARRNYAHGGAVPKTEGIAERDHRTAGRSSHRRRLRSRHAACRPSG